MSDATLTFGTLDLLGDTFHALTAGFSMGSPEVVLASIARQLMDGEIVTHVRDSNRELTLGVRVSGPDVLALNEAEALLVAEVHAARNTLVWKKPGFATPPSVFDTFRGSLREVPDDVRELGDGRVHRVYEVTLPASPHARAVARVSVAGLVQASATDTQVDAMDAATGWTAEPHLYGGSVTVTADTAAKFEGAASLLLSPGGSQFEELGGGRIRWTSAATVTKTFPVMTMDTTPYLSVVVATKGWDTLDLTTYADGVPLAEVASVQVANDWRRITYFTDQPITTIQFDIVGRVTAVGTVAQPNLPPSHGLRLDDLRRQGFPPGGASTLTVRQWVRTLPVRGSVRTPATVQLSSAAAALGDTLLYVGKNDAPGFWPGLRRWRTVGAAGGSPSASPISGDWTNVPFGPSAPPGLVFEVPVQTLKPGAYAVMMRYGYGYGSADWSVTLTAQTVIGGAAVGSSQRLIMKGDNNAAAAKLKHLGVFHLPPTVAPATGSAVVRFTMYYSGTVDFAPTLDDVWLFPLDGALVTLPSLSQRRVFIDSPSIEQPLGAIWVGNNADRSDAFSAGPLLTAYQRPEVAPPSARIWFGTAGATDSAVSLDYYPTAHTNSAE